MFDIIRTKSHRYQYISFIFVTNFMVKIIEGSPLPAISTPKRSLRDRQKNWYAYAICSREVERTAGNHCRTKIKICSSLNVDLLAPRRGGATLLWQHNPFCVEDVELRGPDCLPLVRSQNAVGLMLV